MLTLGAVFADALREGGEGTHSQKNDRRIQQLIELVDRYPRDIEKTAIRSLVTEMAKQYFQGSFGAFRMAQRMIETLPANYLEHGQARENMGEALMVLTSLICSQLSFTQISTHLAGTFLEVALELFRRISPYDPVLAARLLRSCGKHMRGPCVDAFFWRISDNPDYIPTALTAFAEGMLSAESPVTVLRSYLIEKGRTQEVSAQRVLALQEEQTFLKTEAGAMKTLRG